MSSPELDNVKPAMRLDDEVKRMVPPERERLVRASQDEEGVFVYQAFNERIADTALELGKFGEGFGRNRMTWIKPSFGWMLYRSGYGEKTNQERVLRIKLGHDSFRQLLSQAVLSEFSSEQFESRAAWKTALSSSDVRVQWDPDRDLALDKIAGQRAVQIGIGPGLIRDYADNWILSIEDVTAAAHSIRDAIRGGETPAHPFPEQVYQVDTETGQGLGMFRDIEE